MPSTFLADATDIQNWASQRLVGRTQLPRLLRRLIQATTPDLERIQFAADEGVQTGGWDGIVTARTGNAFVPTGVSGWEMGVTKDVKGKADDDYEKRKQDPLGLDPKETTFVFVTSRRWTAKERWAQSRRDENHWADVRAYDADDLDTWLENAPAVHLWLSRLIGKYPHGAQALDDFWLNWTAKTSPPFSPALVIGGRQAAREWVEAWLRGEPAILALQGESPEEALAFLAAVIAAQEKPESEAYFSRSVVIEDATSWHDLALSNSRSILVPRWQGNIEGLTRAVQNGNHVFLPAQHGDAYNGEVLPRMSRAEVDEALCEMGLPPNRATSLATLARRSLPALRRKLACEPSLQKPDWAQAQVARDLLAPLLAGSWQDSNPTDREILAQLAGTSYEQLQEKLVRWSKNTEPPVRLVNGVWMVAAPEDAWRLLAPFLTDDDIRRFKTSALEVLSAPHSPYSFIRFSGLGANAEPSISVTLREGIASTLALMTALSPEVSFVSDLSGQAVASNVVWSLFDKAKLDAALWTSFAPVLPLLAEAAPTHFLDAVDVGLKGQEPFLYQMFTENDNGFGATSPHTYLLWALETLTWNSDFFGRAVLALARLARIEPGGKTLNRPANSLREIFVFWCPNTTVPLERRLQVLDAIRKHEPAVAWPLMLRLLPSQGDVSHPTHGPKWHNWKPDEKHQVPGQEFVQGTEEIVKWLLVDAGTHASRWSELVVRMEGLWPHLVERIIEALESLDPDSFAASEKVALSATLRSVVARHTEFSDAVWAMPTAWVARLEKIGRKLEPGDLVLKYLWRFDRFFPLAKNREMSWQEREKAVAQLRTESIEEILADQGMDGVLRLAAQAEAPEVVGMALSSLLHPPVDVDIFLRENLAAPEPWRAAIAAGWVRLRAWKDDQTWLQERIAAAQEQWRPEQWGEFFLPAPLTSALLTQIDTLDEAAQRCYWSRTQNATLLNNVQEAERVIERLLWVGRSADALRIIHWALNDALDLVTPERIMEVLETVITDASTAELGAVQYDSAQLLEHLLKTDAPRQRLAQIEWSYFALHEYTRPPKVLNAELARDPDLFVDLLCLIYCPRPGETETNERDSEDMCPLPEPEDSVEAQTKARLAERAWSLLWHWHRTPGAGEDGTLDAEHLKSWVARARELAAQKERSVITLIHIGHLFAHSPRDEDGAWPHRAVRDLIEEIANPRLDSGFDCQVTNNRGVTSRGLTDGGEQERVLVEHYEKDAARMADLWPRTASVVRGLAQNYQRHAEDQDSSAELTQDLWR